MTPHSNSIHHKNEGSKQATTVEHTSRKPPSWVRKLKVGAYKVVRFLTSDMWHIQPDEVRGFRRCLLYTSRCV